MKNAFALRDIHYRLLSHIQGFICKNGYSPSVRDLVELTGVGSTSTVKRLLDDLEAKRFIRRTPGVGRTIVLTPGAPETKELEKEKIWIARYL